MQKANYTRILAAVLAIMLFTACAGSAEKVYVMNDTIAYTKPDTDSKAYGTLKPGTKVEVVAESGGWSKLEKAGKYAYVDSDDIEKVTAYNGKTVYLSEDANLLKNYSKTTVLKKLSEGESVKLYATAGEWAYIKADGKKGFVKTYQLTTDKPTKEAYTGYVSVDGAKLFKKNSTSSKVLATLSANTQVSVLAVSGNWCRVKYGDTTGYMKKNLLSKSEVELPVEDTFSAYVNKNGAKVYKKCSQTSKVMATLNLDYEVTVTAYTDIWCRVENKGVEAYMLRADLSAKKSTDPVDEPAPKPDDGISSATPATGTAKAMDWWTSDISDIFAVGTVATITDVETGIAWNEKRLGGTNHADVQPVSAADTAAMKAACGSWSWDRRAIFVTINGVNYAASMNCMPHGSDSISGNDFDGHHCIHFTNSRTHGSNIVCSLHQAAIKKALAASL